MRFGGSTSVRFLACAAAALALGGCAGDPVGFIPAPWMSQVGGTGGSAEPGATQSTAEVVSWGEPSEVPAGFGGSQTVADADGPYLLDTGDKLRVFVYGQPNLSRAYTVDHEGNITVPLIGNVGARGRTTRTLQEAIRRRLGTDYVRDPQVTVDVLQNRPFFIYGEVKTGGQYPYVSGMTIETAIAIAGGYTERASSRSFRITRRNNGFVDQIDAPGDYLVQPGDVVYVNERFF
jgi:polysaccharide export outer membrane protein